MLCRWNEFSLLLTTTVSVIRRMMRLAHTKCANVKTQAEEHEFIKQRRVAAVMFAGLAHPVVCYAKNPPGGGAYAFPRASPPVIVVRRFSENVPSPICRSFVSGSMGEGRNVFPTAVLRIGFFNGLPPFSASMAHTTGRHNEYATRRHSHGARCRFWTGR